jgi:hypothetical protein
VKAHEERWAFGFGHSDSIGLDAEPPAKSSCPLNIRKPWLGTRGLRAFAETSPDPTRRRTVSDGA